MPQDVVNDQPPYSSRMFFSPFLAALAFGISGMTLQNFFPEIGPGARFCFEAAIAASVALLVMFFWKRKPPAGPTTLWTRAFHTILVCSWWIAMVAWCVGLGATTDLLGPHAAPIIYQLAISTFIWAGICFAAAALVLNLLARSRGPSLRQVFRDIGKLLLFLSPTVAAFYLSAYPLRAVLSDASPGLLVCAQIVIAVAVFILVLRIVAAVMHIHPEPAETLSSRPASLRIASQVMALSFVISFFAGTYMNANVISQPDHKSGEYTVPERLRDGRVRYMTPSQSLITEIATFTLFGSVVMLLALGYVQQRRTKKQTPLAEPRAGSES